MGNCLTRRSPLSKSGGPALRDGVQVLTHPPFTVRKLMHDEHSLDKGEAVGANPTRATLRRVKSVSADAGLLSRAGLRACGA